MSMDTQDDWLPDDLPTVEDVGAREAQMEVERLAGLSPTEYEGERKAAAKRLGWRATVLDTEVEKARPRKPAAEVGEGDEAAPVIETLEAWPDPVDGASLAEEIRETLRAHVVFAAPGDADVAALWALGSYLMDTWRLWPRLLITSPTKACGKSTLLEALEAVVHRGLILSNAKVAGVFRAIEAWAPSLLLDEADTWMRQDEELAGILNSGHTRRTARVIRVVDVKGKLTPTLFSTWCPMVIAGIGGQRDTLESRSIVIGLRRKLASETVARMPMDLHERCLRIRRQAARWANDNAITLGASTSEPPECGNDRRRDNYTPLWRIAETLGGSWPDRIATAYAAQSISEDDDDEPAQVLILKDVLNIFDEKNVVELSPTDLIGELLLMEDRPWVDWKHGKPITVHGLARLLKAFKVKTTVRKAYGKASRVYFRREVEAASKPYVSEGGSETRNLVTSHEDQRVTPYPTRNPDPQVTSSKPPNSLITREGYEVTGSETPTTDHEQPDDPFDPEA